MQRTFAALRNGEVSSVAPAIVRGEVDLRESVIGNDGFHAESRRKGEK
jgi:hypothetical protein